MARPRNAEQIIGSAKFDAKNLIGETADFLLANMKAARNLEPWEKLTEEGQREMIDQAKHQAMTLVAGVIDALVAKGFPSIPAKVESFSGKTGEGTVALKTNVTAHDFAKMNGRLEGHAILVFASVEDYGHEMEAKPEPNQQELIDPETGEISEAA